VQLHPGAAVTTFKNVVDRVVTEYGVADLRGGTIRERTRKLIGIAHSAFRDELERQARELGYL
jgi:acyl-CoA hydrolase